MPKRRRVIHRSVTNHLIPTESRGKPVQLHVPTYTLADFRRAYPTGQFRCGSCGELWPSQEEIDATRRKFGKDLLSAMERRWEPDTVISFALSHEYFPDAFYTQDPALTEDEQALAECPVLYTDGIRDEYVLNDDGRYEWLYGFVFRDARSPEGVYREVWYPTAVFRAAGEIEDGFPLARE
ncbi:MAG: hypothetical protein OXM03_03540 [Chloroflexota bacterium]|nr:hypothetical protein [Chloroflexota bacterium]MDE2839681.1 hypothetical protein [Chloroflexota bacterium]MDE2931391.1 hypothetical protein [Chloroflexota bacterium]